MTVLQGLAPKAQITLDSENKRLMVVASSEDHETIQTTIAEFETSAADEPALRFHPLKEDPPANLTTILQQLVPKAQITLDTENNRLMAVATSEDHDTIQATIEQFETGAAQMPVLRFHPLIQEPPADLLTVLQKLVPTAQVTLDAENKRLMVVATPEDQETVKSTVEEFETNTPLEEPSKLVVYTVTSAQRKRFDMLQPTLVAEMPGMQVIGEAEPGELAIWAKPTDHLLLSEIMEQLKAEVPEQDQRKLVGYRIKSVDPDSVLQMLQKLYADTEFVLDLKANRLLVWARPGVHDSIKASLEEIEGAGAPDEQQRFQAFPIYTTDVATIVTTLQPLVPNAKLAADPKTKRLIAWGTPTELEIIRTAVESLKQGDTAGTTPRLEVYHLKKADPQTTLTLLLGLLPDVQFTLDAPGKRIIAYAVPSDHETIKATLERVDAQGPAEEQPRFETYPIYGADTPEAAGTFIASLQPLVPGAKLTIDAKGRKLIAWGTPDEQEVVRKAVESMGTGSAENLPRLKVYRLTKAAPNSVLTALQSLLPDAQLSVDSETNSLVALAVPADHETIQSTVEQIEAEGPAEDRPRFETYPIYGVNDTTAAATFVATLQPLVPKARLTVDVKGKKLVAFGTSDEQEVIRKAVESMGRGGGASETMPKLEVYRLTKADPSSVLALLQSLLPDAQFSVDSPSKSLVALAVPADQETIKSTIDKIETEAPEDQPRFETYPIFGAGTSVAAGTFTTTLQPLVPGAKLTVDAKGRKLIAWGTPEEHEIIRGAMLSLGRGGGTPETTPQVEVYTLTKADPTSALTLLQNLLPDAQLTVDPQTNSLVALAIPADQATIKATLEQLQPEEPGPNTPVLRFHLLSRKPTDGLIATLQPLVPKAQITLDAENDRLMAVATPADHEVIQSTLKEFEAKTPPEEPNKLIVYPVTSAQKTRLQAILPTLSEELPGVQIVADDSPDEVAIWAKPTQHIVLAQMIEELKGDVSEERKRGLVAYSVKSADPSSVLTVLQDLYPDVKFVLEPKTNRLLVWTRPEEHQSIKASLEKIAGEGPAEDQPRFETYAISAANMAAASTFVATLQPLVPNVRLTIDSQGRKLIAWGTPEEHEIVRKALEGLGRGGASAETTPQLQVYGLTKADPNSTLALLQNLVPDAQLSVDPQTNSIVALAIPADQATIKATLEQLQPEKPGPNTPVLRFHLLSREPTDGLIATLQPLVPKAQITLDAENDRLMAVATPADHEIIQSTLEEFEAKTPPEEPGKLIVYPVTPSQRRRFEALLPTLTEDLPGVQIIPDGKPGELAVWAKPTQHLVIAEIIQEITGGAARDGQFRLGVYTIKSADPQSVLSVLQRLFPDTEFILDEKTRRLMVWTSPAEHETIQAAIDQMDAGVPDELEEEFAAYPVPNVDPSLAIQMLQEQVPDVKFINDTASRTILAWGRKADHRKIAAMIEQMSAKAPAGIAPTAALYSLDAIDATSATQILQLAVPQARITVGPGTDQLVAWATPRDHEVIKSTLAAVDVESAKAKGAKAVIYTLEGMSRVGTIYASRFLTDTVPDARFAVGAEENQLVAWATPEVHEQIASLVDQLTQESPEKARRIVVYTVQATTATAAMQVLATAVPQAKVTLDTNDPQKLTVWARPTEHETIASILKEIDAEGAAPTSTVKVYTVEGMTAAAVTTILSTQVPQARVSLGTDPQQLVVWARPADHERIGQLVDEIAAAATEGEAARTARVYTLESLTATAATTFLTQVVPQAQLSPGSEPDQLIAWARPADHEKIATTLEAIDVEGAEETEVVVYTLEGMSASAAYYVLNFLTTAVPQARFVQGVEPGQLVAWAKPKDHDEIAQLVEQLTKEAPPEKAPMVAVYTLQSITAASAMQVLTTAVPQAKVTLDTNDPQKLTVWARPTEHETIASILKEIDAEGAAPTSTVKVYTVEGMTAAAVTTILSTQVPQARVSLGTDPQQLVVWARPADHERIGQLVDEIAAAATEGEAARTARVYTLESLTATAATTFLTQVVPQAQLSPGSEPDQLIAWARPADHEKIATTLEAIDVEGAEETEVVVYTLEGMSASAAYYVLNFLTTAVPQARFVQGVEPGQLVAWAKPKDHAEIAKLVEQLTKEAPPEKAAKVAVYTLQSTTATNAMQMITTAVPQAKVTLDPNDSQKLNVWARPTEHETIAGILKEIDAEGAAPTSTVKVYTVEGMTAAAVTTILSTQVPQARVSLGTDPQQLVVWARPADHERIGQLVDEIAAAATEGEAARTARVYTLESLTATAATTFLTQVVPQAQLSPGSEPDQLIAWARPADHEKIATTLEAIDVEGAEETEVVVYTLEGMSASAAYYVLNFLTTAVPQARFVQGVEPGQLVAWAKPKDHAEIAKLVEQLTKEAPPEKAAKVAVYTLQSTTASNAMQMITTAVPQAKVTLDTNDPQKLTVWARPTEHETIATILKEIDAEGPETVSTIKIYTIEGMTASAAMTVLQAQVPQARISLAGDPRQLVVWARPPEQERIRQIVDGIAAAAEEAEAGQQMVVYTLEALDATTAMSLLRMVVPQAQLIPGAETDQLVALASLKEHDLIQSTLKQIDVEAPEEAEPVMYTLEGVSASNAYYVRLFLAGAVPDARFVQGIEPMQLIAWAKPKDHEEIAKLVKELTQEPPPDKAPNAVVYNLESIPASAATQVLQQAVPLASFTADSTDPQKMTVWARPLEHETIARVLQEIDVEGTAKTTFALRIYTIEGMTASYAMQALRTLVPAAQVSLGSDPQQLVVWARPADHERIQQMVDEVAAAAGEGEAARIAQVYTLESLTATTAMSFLRQVVPQAELSPGSQPDQLIAWARPKDHDRIASTLKQIDVEGPEDAAAVVYTLEGVSSYGAASYVVSFLTNAFPEARFLQGAQPSQVVAWARPKDHEEIADLIDDLTAGPPPEKAPKAVVYNLKHVAAASANQVLRGAVPNATLTTDTADPQKLTALATRTDHEMIASILQDIDVESPSETASTVKVYTVEGMTASAASTILRVQVPQASVSLGSDPQQLVVWARPADHERIGQIVDQIASASDEAGAGRQMVVYTLEALDATTAMSLLRMVVPQAQLSPGAETGQMVAWASAKEHDLIQRTLKQIDVEGPEDATVVVYTLEGMTSRSSSYYVTQFLQSTFPEARFVAGTDPSQLVVWARPKDHEEIAELVDQLTAGPPPEKAPKAVVYNLKHVAAASANQVLRGAVPNATLTTDTADPQKLTALATRTDHEMIASILQDIDVESPAETASRVEVYTLEGLDTSSSTLAFRFLDTAVPNAEFTMGVEPGQVVAWASPKDHDRIRQLVEQLTKKAPPEKALRAVVYGLESITAQNAMAVLQTAVPEADFNAGEDPQTLIAWARPSDHEVIENVLKEIDVEAPAETTSRAQVYTLEGITAASALQVLRTSIPQARITLGTDPQQLVAWARPADHKIIQEMVDQMAAAATDEAMARTPEVYTVQSITASTAIEIVGQAVPEAQLSAGAEPDQFIALARSKDHELIRKTLQKVDVKGPEDAVPTVYALEGMDSRYTSYTLRFLRDAVPNANFTIGADPRQLVVWARPKDHEEIGRLVKELTKKMPALTPQALVYTLKSISPDSATQTLQQAVPDATFTTDEGSQKLTAVARPADHEMIERILKEIDVEEPADAASSAVVYTLEWMAPSTAIQVLESAVPDALFNEGTEANQLIAWARPADHEKIGKALEQIDVEGPADAAVKVVAYPLPGMESRRAYFALSFIRDAVPEATLTLNSDSSQLIAWARPKDHERIAELIEQVLHEPPELARKAMVYTLKWITAEKATRFLEDVARGADFATGEDPQQLIAFARPAEHAVIAGTLKEIDVEPSPETTTRAVVYSLKSISPDSAIETLEEAVPSASFTTAEGSQKLTALARPADHVMIERILKEIDVEEPADAASSAVVYTLEWMAPSTAIQVLESAVPDALFNEGTEANQLIAWARPADHEKIGKALEQIDVEGPADAAVKVVAYPLPGMESRRAYFALSFIRDAVPEATLTLNSDSSQLIAWARPKDHERIAELIEQVLHEPPELARKAMVYTLKWITAEKATRFLEDVARGADFATGEDPQQLIAFARPAEHAVIAGTLKEIDVEPSPETTTRAVVYSLKSISPDSAIETLEEAVPSASFTTAEGSQKLTALARPADHVMIERILKEIDVEEPADAASSAVVYTLESVKAATAIQILQQAVPDASFNEGSEANQLIAWARPKDHEIIERALKQIDVEGPADKVARPVVYALEDMTTQRAYYALTFLRQAVPEAELTVSSDGSRLIAFATPKDHELLEQLIQQLNEEPPELARQAVVYDLQVITATEAMTLLRQAVPMADLSAGAEPSQLVAWARQSDQEKIVRILEKIDREGPAETAATARIYSLEGLDSRSAIYANLFLRQTVPDARFSPGAEPTQIVAWARPKDHELIAELVQQLIEEPPALARKAVVYHLQEITATEAMTLMRQAVPGATISAGADASQLVVWARQSDQEKVQRILEQVDQAGPEGTAATAVIYSLEGLSSRSAIFANRFLQQTVPDARFSPGAEPTQIVAWARPKDHELIAELVKQLVEEPPELARKAVAYDLKHATATIAIQALSSAVPDASLSPGADENQVVAWARGDDHEKIQEILKELDREPSPETEPKAMVYSLEAADAAEAMRVLRTAVPQARLSIGAEPHQLIAWARPADHEIIQEIVDKMVEKGPDELARKVVVYTLETTDAQDAIRFLSSAVPDAEFSIGTDPRRLIAWARPRDHEIISRAVEAMSKEEPPETAPRVVVYTLKTVDATRALELLREAVPDAQLTVGTNARQLIAWARPADHEIIADAVEKMSQEEPPETRPRVVLYDVEATGAQNAMRLLQAAVPEAELAVGDDPGKLIAWARPEDHEVIQAAVEQFEADSWLEGKRIISVYPIKAGDAESLVQVLQTELKDHAQFVVDSERNSLIVWADAKHHEAINKTIEQFIEGLEGTQEMTSQVYRFQLADPAVALSVLQTLVPSARLALDENTQSIVASALPEDHDKIRATIQEMEREDVEGQRPVLRIHRVETGDVGNIYSALYALFRQDPTVQLNVDRANDAIIAIASPLKHDKIDQLLEEVAKGVLLDAANVLQLYSMKNVDTDSAMEILETLLEKRGATADLSLDSRSNQLVAIARPDHHELIRETLEQLRREEPGLEIYDLQYVDPVSAEMAIGSEFDDEGYLSAPQVDIDPITQQLFVRANPEQHQRIRQLLIKMGETKLQLLGDRSTGTMRVIPFRGDLEGAIAEIQRIWPKLRENEIRVVTPSVALPAPAEPQPKPEAPKEAPAEPKPEPSAKPAEAKPAEPAPKEAPPAEAKPKPEAPKEAPAEPKPEPAAKPEEAKPAEAMPAEPAPKEAPPAEAKPKPEAPKEAPAEPKPEPAAKPEEAKPAEPAPKEAPPAEAKPKPEAPKEAPAEPKPEPAAKPVEAMPAEPTPKEAPPAEPKPEPAAKPEEAKPAEAKPAEPAAKEAPPAEAKPKPEAPKETPAEPKPEPAAKPAEAKPAEPAPKEAPPAEAKPKPEAPKETPAEPAPTEATYTLSSGTASEAIEALKAKFPDAKLSAGDQPSLLVVVAKPADHEAVKKALEEMSKGQPAEKPQEPAPKETPPAEKPAEPAPKEAPPAEKPAESSSGESAFLDPWRIFARFELGSPTEADQNEQPPKEPPQEQPQPKAAEQKGSKDPQQSPPVEKPVSGPEDAAEKPAESPPPLYIVLGEGSVTIVSDDPEALDQFENLLRTLLPSTNTIGRNISVFELKHSSAAAVAEKLEDLFRSSPFGFRRGTGSVVIVPDERMNSILVQGSRIDRETVEGLLTVLDSDEVPDALAGQKPKLIPIKNVDAQQIAEVVQSVFKSQLSPPTSRSRNGRTTTSVLPSPQVAVDEGTNSLVVMATSPLLDEIVDLAEKLDEEAGKNPSRRVKIIPLEKTNASRVQRALEQIFNKPTSSRRSR